MRGFRGVLIAAALVAAAGCGSESAEPDESASESVAPTAASSDPPTSAAPSSPRSSAAPPSEGVLAAGAGVERAPADPDAPVAELVAGFNEAGFDLWRTQSAADNVVFSPGSIGHALLMARGAADEPTGAAIDKAFGLPDGASAHQAWNAVDRRIRQAQTKDVTVTIADRIWPGVDVQPEQRWIDLLRAEHGADVQPLDFGDADGSRKVINRWVSDKTRDLIPELLPAGLIQPNTMLVLTDTLYFEARWQTPFGKYGPVDGTFTALDGTERPVELMQELELSDRRGKGDGFVGAELPYLRNEYSMLVIVPDEGRFEEIRDRFDQQMLDDIDDTFTTGPYELLLPKWEDDHQIDLLSWLSELRAAPGSYPSTTPDAFLDGAVHAADIAVDEEGTVAAAATGLDFASSGPPTPELTVAADQPFLYLIRHRASGLVLFAGQVTDPA